MALSFPKNSHSDFFAECEDLIKECELSISEIQTGSNNSKAIQSFYRSIHTLKGSAQLAGHFDIASIAHSIESSLGPANAPCKQVGPKLQQFLKKSIRKIFFLGQELKKHAETTNYKVAPKTSINGFLQEFHVAVQDLATKLGKIINFTVLGEDQHLDYRLIRSLKAPLIQIIKNSCDHGIECPIERLHKGKSPDGTISILTSIYGSELKIEISDDGKGLANKKGHQLIFEPGFTTSTHITEISGRGIGMDIVASEIKKLHGNLTISSVQNVGFKITITIPIPYQ